MFIQRLPQHAQSFVLLVSTPAFTVYSFALATIFTMKHIFRVFLDLHSTRQEDVAMGVTGLAPVVNLIQ